MSTLTKIDPKTVPDGLKTGRFHLIDIREADEFAREHICGAVSIPLSGVEQADVKLKAGRTALFHCKSGMRSRANCAGLASRRNGDALILDGGLDAWKKAGLPMKDNARAPLPISRQVEITAVTLVLSGALIGTFIHPAGYSLSGFVGPGLIVAGVSGWCGMANVLAAMQWNRTA